ncbi:MAG: deoxyribose-phosphate aldolase [Thermoproteales archaeon]|nr:deoxyribose-phosphate aldolase [Thermoproteales archaeon]
MSIDVLLRKYSFNDIASKIDHTLLKPYAISEDIKKICLESIEYGFYGCCISPSYLPLANKFLVGSGVKLITVVGFPLGSYPTEIKIREIEYYLKWDIDEVDIVMNIGLLKEKKYQELKNELVTLVDFSHLHGLIVKIIIETSYLSDEEIALVSRLVRDSKADFIKTNTGFGPRGVNFRDVYLIKKSISNDIKIKAAGGIRGILETLTYLEMGVDRIGTSSSIRIMKEYDLFKDYYLG